MILEGRKGNDPARLTPAYKSESYAMQLPITMQVLQGCCGIIRKKSQILPRHIVCPDLWTCVDASRLTHSALVIRQQGETTSRKKSSQTSISRRLTSSVHPDRNGEGCHVGDIQRAPQGHALANK